MFFKPKPNQRRKPASEETLLEAIIGIVTLALMGWVLTALVFCL